MSEEKKEIRDGYELWSNEKGLTKREFIAMNILASWAYSCTDANNPQHYEHAAKSSVQLADVLLKELTNE